MPAWQMSKRPGASPLPTPPQAQRLCPVPSRESRKQRRNHQAVDVALERTGQVAVQQMRERPHRAAARAEPEQAPVQAKRRQALKRLNRDQGQTGKGGKHDQAEDQASGPATVCGLRHSSAAAYFLTSSRPSESLSLLDAMRIRSTSHQMPQPPTVTSLRMPIPM